MEATAFSEEADDYVEPDIPFPLSQLNFGSFFFLILYLSLAL